MAKGLFASPKKAMLFVGMTMFSVLMLVGTEDDEGALIQAASGIQDPEAGLEVPPPRDLAGAIPERRSTPDVFSDSGFASDEELIDDAAGFDPTPEPTDPISLDPSEGDVYVLMDND